MLCSTIYQWKTYASVTSGCCTVDQAIHEYEKVVLYTQFAENVSFWSFVQKQFDDCSRDNAHMFAKLRELTNVYLLNNNIICRSDIAALKTQLIHFVDTKIEIA